MHDPTHDSHRPSASREMIAAKYAEDFFAQFGLNFYLLVRTLLLALGSGLVAALADEVLSLPTSTMFLTLGGMVSALNGSIYASLKRRYDRSGLMVGMLSGWLAMLTWFFTLDIVAPSSVLLLGLDWVEVTVTGILAGLIGFGWFMTVHLLPERFARE